MSKLDLAIGYLKLSRSNPHGDWKDYEKLDAAIRVLEAAGKVDQDQREWAIGWMSGEFPKTIHALLLSLPDDTDAKEE